MYGIFLCLHPANSYPRVGILPNVYVTASTRYGDARIRITKRQWDNAFKGVHAARDHIAIKVKSRLNEDGYKVYWLKWVEITFDSLSKSAESPVPSSTILYSDIKKFDDGVAKLTKQPENLPQPQPSPLALHNAEVDQMAKRAEAMVTEDVPQAAAELFPEAFGFTPPSSDFDGCGCTPRPITAM